ncbi:hypothetical protein FRC10_010455 [Ceratobasidium sp. 414]|nr:hypothetical protein FRC10_010455 [Ceratobasidium sp. 414]
MASQQDPYPEGSVFAVHKGFKPGVYRTFREFRSQTAGFPKEISAVFDDENHAEVFVKTGKPPPGVEPLVANTPAGRFPDGLAVVRPAHTTAAPKPTKIVTSTSGDTSLESSPARTFPKVPAPLPTPSVSPDRSLATPFVSASQPSRPRIHGSSERPYASQPVRSNPPPATPQKPIKTEDDVEMDQGGDTEPEDDDRAFKPISHAPVPPTTPPAASRSGGPVRRTQSAVTPGAKPLGQSIADVLRREISSGTVFPKITADTTAPPSAATVLPTGSPSKSATKHTGKQSLTGTNLTTLSTPDPTPAPRASHKRMRECTHCGGTGQVPCSEEDSDSSRANDKAVIFKRSSTSPTLERRAKRSSDGKRSESRDAKLKARVDKGKGKARTSNVGAVHASEVPKANVAFPLGVDRLQKGKVGMSRACFAAPATCRTANAVAVQSIH